VKRKSVLVVEDERDIAQLLQLHLSEFCDEVVIANNGRDGLSAAEQRPWGLIILDLGLPGIGGLEICRRIRQDMRYTPVLMLTAKASESDRVRGLDTGADDYVTKPFCVQELVARVRAIFRRCAALREQPDAHASTIIHHAGLSIDLEQRRVDVDGHPVELTAREFDLLAHFARHPGRVYTRAQLLDHVWGYSHQGYEHTVNSHINRLRSKIEADTSRPRFIVTVWGVGYRFGDGRCNPQYGHAQHALH
jgi:DNA-binding response OmpR family regulator